MGLEPTGDPSIQQLPMSQPDPSQAAPQPQGKPSFWKSLLVGALNGLGNSQGATSFGGGLGAGVAGAEKQQQQQVQNQLAQDQSARADQAQQNADEEHQARMAQMQLQNRQMASQLHALDPHDPQFVQQTINKLADQGDAGLAAGALMKTPAFDSAAEAEQYAQENHLSTGNYQVRVTPFRDASGTIKYAGLEYDNAPSTKDVQVSYLGQDGKEVTATIPAGTPKSKIAQLQVAAAQQQVQSQFKKKDQELKDQGTQIENDAQLLASGKMAPSQIPSKGGARDKAIARANELTKDSGGYNAMQAESNFKAGQALDKYFTSGKGAENLTAFNTASDHLDQLNGLVDSLGNGNVTALNDAAQRYAKATGNPAPTSFDAVRNAAIGEVTKVFAGAGAAQAERDEIAAPLSHANSPAALKDAIVKLRGLMASKKEALQNQYQQGKSGKPAFDSSHETDKAKGGSKADPLGIR